MNTLSLTEAQKKAAIMPARARQSEQEKTRQQEQARPSEDCPLYQEKLRQQRLSHGG